MKQDWQFKKGPIMNIGPFLRYGYGMLKVVTKNTAICARLTIFVGQ
jgi:hypothetical protein